MLLRWRASAVVVGVEGGQIHPHLVSCAGGLSQTLDAVLFWGDVVLPR